MINVVVTYFTDCHQIKSIIVDGHANSGTYGNDLICAAVSAIITGGANALIDDKKEENFEIVLKEGHASIIYNDKYPYLNDDGVKLATMLIMLKTIQESNPRFIKITEKH